MGIESVKPEPDYVSIGLISMTILRMQSNPVLYATSFETVSTKNL